MGSLSNSQWQVPLPNPNLSTLPQNPASQVYMASFMKPLYGGYLLLGFPKNNWQNNGYSWNKLTSDLSSFS